MTESLTRDTFSGFLVIFSLPFFALFFCCLRHVSLPNWQISTPHLIPLNNKNFPFFPTCFLGYVTLPPPQSSLSPSFSSSIFSSFSFILFVSSFMQVVVTTTVLKVMALCPSKGCNNRIHRPMLKNKGVIFIYLLIWHLFFGCVFFIDMG